MTRSCSCAPFSVDSLPFVEGRKRWTQSVRQKSSHCPKTLEKKRMRGVTTVTDGQLIERICGWARALNGDTAIFRRPVPSNCRQHSRSDGIENIWLLFDIVLLVVVFGLPACLAHDEARSCNTRAEEKGTA